MFVINYLLKDVVPPKINHTSADVSELIEGYGFTHFPVFEGLSFIGNIPQEVLSEMSPDEEIGSRKADFERFYLTDKNTLFDVINMMHIRNANIIPVFDLEEHYLGYISVDSLMSALSLTPFIAESGAVMLIEVAQHKFSMTEIAKIVEENNGKLFGIIITAYKEDKVQISVKLNAVSLASVGETFERYGYHVVHKFYNDQKEKMIQDRYSQLMKYLDS